MKARTAALAHFALLFLFLPTAHAVTFDWATVGNAGNADDTHGAGYGGVDYAYRISKTEVTNAQYTEFLNAVDPTGANSLSLYFPNMSSDARGGINFNALGANGSMYKIKSGRDNNPVVFVSFFDAMRFTNWLENGQRGGGTESGVYTIGNGVDEIRNPNATFSFPSRDEWYKAAYHKNDGVTGNYWGYPTSTDTEPYSDNTSSLNTPDDTNVANFINNDGIANGYDDGYAVTGSISFVSGQNYLTDVGAYSLATSPYGTFDQGGNVWEWNEAVASSSWRGINGGSWSVNSGISHVSGLGNGGPTSKSSTVGFRVASIPEPSSLLLGALASMGALLWRRRLS